MKQEDKDLLLRYLCMALPYGLICSIYRIDDWNVGWRDENLTGYFDNGTAYEFYFGKSPISIDNDISKIKPYLRPMSSMTEKEKKEYRRTQIIKWVKSVDCTGGGYYEYKDTLKTYDWLKKHHFDFMGLIPRNLAIEVTEKNNPYNLTEE